MVRKCDNHNFIGKKVFELYNESVSNQIVSQSRVLC